jgi:hypothetical protein
MAQRESSFAASIHGECGLLVSTIARTLAHDESVRIGLTWWAHGVGRCPGQ